MYFWPKNVLHQTFADSEQVFFTQKSPFVLVYPPKPKNYVIWIHAVSNVPLCSSSNFPHLKRCWGHDLFWSVLIIILHKSNIDEEYYWTEKEHARPMQNSFELMPQGYYEQKTPKS